ncbi:hypothetical protein LTR97_006858 [Elasticomyces elasticus]|uniref:Uncharacterized protein n=1 Tax=Elasticomyces elasticus TaxID=574655 RepID=A0AAN7VRB5_9PEZI|nr:hypothetical protein LTR97_006858 [Elasticomyces elasticus]
MADERGSLGTARRSLDATSSAGGLAPTTGQRIEEQNFADATTSFDPAHPRVWTAPAESTSSAVYRQLLGLNPFKTSYLSLYTSLHGWQDRSVACIGLLCATAAGVPLPLIGVIFGHIISSFPPAEDALRTRIIQLLGVAVAYLVLTALYATSFGLTGEKIAIRTRERLLDCLLHLDQAYLDTHDLDVTSLLSEKVDVIHAGCSEKVGIFIQSMSYFSAAMVVGFILSPRLTGILLAAVIPALVIVTTGTRHYGSIYSKQTASHGEAASSIVENALRSAKVVQAFGMMDALCSRHSEALDRKVSASVRKAIVAAVQVGCIYFIAYSVNGLAFYVGSRMAVAGEAGGNAGTIFAVVFLILDASLVVAQFAPFLETFAQAAAAQETIQGLLDAVSATQRSESPKQALPSPQHDLHGCAIQFKHVSFAYPARATIKALDDLNLTIQPGSFTALVGTSGGGKSTLVSLLTGQYREYSGNVTIGGQELRGLDVIDVRAQIAMVEQEHELFTGTIEDNILHGVRNKDLTPADLTFRCKEAVQAANIDFLGDLPDGILTRLNDGMQLSGGQRQRVCLARALIRRPAILILDEPTAALDARSEMAVMSAVHAAAASGVTVLMVAHRLSTVLNADHIAVFSEGTVVEQGTPISLSDSDGVFKSLLNAQSTTMDNSNDSDGSRETLFETEGVKDEPNDKTVSRNPEVDEMQSRPEDDNAISSRTVVAQVVTNLKPDLFIVVIGLFASVASGGLLLGEAILFGNLVALLNNGPDSPDFQKRANFFCLMFFVVGCVGLASWVGSGTAFGIASTRSVSRIQRKLLRRLLHLDMQWYATPGRAVHSLMSAFTKDSGDLSCLSGPALGTIFTTITSVAGGMILALCVAWKIAIVLLSAVPVMIAAGFVRIKILAMADARRREAYKGATNLAAEACRYRSTVTVFGLEDHIVKNYRTALKIPYERGRWFAIFSNLILAISLSITYFVYALAYWWGARQVRNGNYTGKEFFTVLPAMLFSAQSAGQLFSLSPEIARARGAAVSVSKLLCSQAHILADTKDEALVASSVLESPLEKSDDITAHIVFDHASLSYSSAESRMVLRDISFTVRRGESVALVGPSGAGKSSAIALIERFYDTTSGSVRIDNEDIRQLDVRALRDRIGLVSQDPDLLPGGIAENIRLGAARHQVVSDEQIHEVCVRCGLDSFVKSLPEGYNTECGSASSSKLSGGQRQRIALARALIRNPEILLLDEPTSALDAHSEQHIQQTLAEASKGRTTVMVAHRLASVREVDKICVFNEGRVVEEGTHEELVANKQLYASMAAAQNVI